MDCQERQENEERRWAMTGVSVSVGIAVTLLGAEGAGWRAAISVALAVALLYSSARVVRTACAALWVGNLCADLWLGTETAGVLHDYPVEVSPLARAHRGARTCQDRRGDRRNGRLVGPPGRCRREGVASNRPLPCHESGTVMELPGSAMVNRPPRPNRRQTPP